MTHLSKAQRAAAAGSPLEQSADDPFEPRSVFGRDGRLELEIGFGKGKFLLRSAEERPDVDFIGIERASKFFRLALGRATRRGLRNVRFIRSEARAFIEERLPDRSLDRVHVYFPDPWPKRRQFKRRLLDPPFLHSLAKKLRPGADLHLATDHADYFEEILLSFLTERAFSRVEPLSGDGAPLTNYEQKYRLEGRPIYRARYQISSSPDVSTGGPPSEESAGEITSRQNFQK